LYQAITRDEQAAETNHDGDPQYRKSIQTIDFNLGLLHLFKENLSQAHALFARVLDQAKSDQNKELQGLLMCKLAYVKAKQGRYHEAEQDIIVRVVPHFRQLKSSAGYKGLVEAYMTLSDIYRLQNRHPEAQWFLLQAREVVNTHHLRQYMPDIVFALAEVKKVSGNTEVALDEYRMVEKMLDGRSDSLLMHLAILDAISAIYHRHGEHEEALHALDQFDRLKTQLISSDFLF
jgi:tetratricopeptide (TPR) repeat protein